MSSDDIKTTLTELHRELERTPDLDEDLRGEVVLPGPGTYRVSAVIRIENSSGGYNTAYYGAGEVEVAEGQTELTIDAPPQLR